MLAVVWKGARSYAAGDGPNSIAVSNLAGSGENDIVIGVPGVSIDPGGIMVMLGDGKGGFSSTTKYRVGKGAWDVIVGDFTGDGVKDLLAVQGSTTMYLLSGQGGGAFNPDAKTINVPFAVTSGIAGDFNRDGNLDLALATSDGLAVLLGAGDGTFQLSASYEFSETVGPIVAADMNGDNWPDLAVIAGADAYVLLGRGDGTFRDPKRFSSSASLSGGLLAADFTGIGNSDLATSTFSNSTSTNLVQIFRNDGGGNFTQSGSYSLTDVSGTNSALAAADFNDDGVLDLAVLTQGGVAFLLGTGAGNFEVFPEQFASAGQVVAFGVGDFNSDSQPDLAIINTSPGVVSVLLNNPRFAVCCR